MFCTCLSKSKRKNRVYFTRNRCASSEMLHCLLACLSNSRLLSSGSLAAVHPVAAASQSSAVWSTLLSSHPPAAATGPCPSVPLTHGVRCGATAQRCPRSPLDTLPCFPPELMGGTAERPAGSPGADCWVPVGSSLTASPNASVRFALTPLPCLRRGSNLC